MKITIRCDECNDIIFRGIEMLPYGDDEVDIDGKYIEGAGRCEECGRELCQLCGDIQDGLCESCRE